MLETRGNMPFINTVEFNYAFSGKPIIEAPSTIGGLPSYYTVNSGFLMYQNSYNSNSLVLKSISDLNVNNSIRTYTALNTSSWTVIHDKDLDSNIWYGMAEGTRVLIRYTLPKGGTTMTTSNIISYSGATTSVLGACYAPACMWSNSISYGAFIIGGYSQSVLHVLPFTSTKGVNAGSTYAVSYTGEVYGTEVIPKQASGFNNHFGLAYTRNTKQMSSWTINLDCNSSTGWTNRVDNSYTGGTNGPLNGDGMIYYPPGKQITFNDAATTSNRIAMNDTSSARLYVWNVTESGTSLLWSYLSTISILTNGGYPYHMSSNTYDSVS